MSGGSAPQTPRWHKRSGQGCSPCPSLIIWGNLKGCQRTAGSPLPQFSSHIRGKYATHIARKTTGNAKHFPLICGQFEWQLPRNSLPNGKHLPGKLPCICLQIASNYQPICCAIELQLPPICCANSEQFALKLRAIAAQFPFIFEQIALNLLRKSRQIAQQFALPPAGPHRPDGPSGLRPVFFFSVRGACSPPHAPRLLGPLRPAPSPWPWG